MSTSRLRAVSESVGVVAVVASLVFVGIQVRQSAEATRAATRQNLSDAWREWNLAMSDPVLWEPAARLSELDDPAQGSYEDTSAVVSLMRSLFTTWSNAFFQHDQGYLDEETCQACAEVP
ncbi:MAG: hypothetical protein PVJ02_10690 [Gemmatimonadota bacterium]